MQNVIDWTVFLMLRKIFMRGDKFLKLTLQKCRVQKMQDFTTFKIMDDLERNMALQLQSFMFTSKRG